MAGEKKTLILSDTHLGRGDALTAEDLRPLWRGFDRVVFNGDTAELQMPRLKAAAERAVWRLRAMADADGVGLTLVCGNHDTQVSDTQHLTLMGGRVLVMHGHALHPAVAPWTKAGRPMAAMTRAGMSATPPELAGCLDERLRLAQRVASDGFALDPTTHRSRGPGVMDLLRRPHEALRAAWFWRSVPGLASAFLQRYCPAAEVLVMGHSHRQGVWQHGGRTVLNTGSFGFPGRPRAVVAQGQTLAVHDVLRSAAGCSLAPTARFEMTLQGAADQRARERRERAA